EEDVPVFNSIEDRTFRLNQQNSDLNISSPFAQSQFVPDIAFIADFSYVFRNLKNGVYSEMQLPGLNTGHRQGINSDNGFNLNYGELVIGSTVDPYFALFTTFHLQKFAFEIEEAYISTRSLPFSLQAKAGRFFSSFGRLNSVHHHYWHFADQPIVYN